VNTGNDTSNQFVENMDAAEFTGQHYRGRLFWQGPAAEVERWQRETGEAAYSVVLFCLALAVLPGEIALAVAFGEGGLPNSWLARPPKA
jgi:hypothetical protein